MSTKWMRAPAGLMAPLGLLVLGACAGVPREPVDEVTKDPAFDPAEVVDVAILRPEVASPSDDKVLARHMREAARRVLIDDKLYSVLSDQYVDRTLAGTATAAPASALTELDADAVLQIDVDQWEDDKLTQTGRIHAGGTLVLHGPSGMLWEYRFRDRPVTSPFPVTSGNRAEAATAVARSLIRELLSRIPPRRPGS